MSDVLRFIGVDDGFSAAVFTRSSSNGGAQAFPVSVGKVLGRGIFVVDGVLKQVDWDKARVIVEYGPGVGTFTTKLLKRMRADATLIALEINPDFFKFLGKSLRDPRFHLVQESAAEIDAVLVGNMDLDKSHSNLLPMGGRAWKLAARHEGSFSLRR